MNILFNSEMSCFLLSIGHSTDLFSTFSFIVDEFVFIDFNDNRFMFFLVVDSKKSIFSLDKSLCFGRDEMIGELLH